VEVKVRKLVEAHLPLVISNGVAERSEATQ